MTREEADPALHKGPRLLAGIQPPAPHGWLHAKGEVRGERQLVIAYVCCERLDRRCCAAAVILLEWQKHPALGG
eukprot:4444407-Prymnesium_polylepis.2